MSTPVVVVSGAGTQGPRGAAFLSGAGAPTSNMVGSIDGDLYLDTTNVGFYYGPRTSGLWGTPHPFGNSLNGVPLVNITATTAPTTANDTTQGYSRGSYWINTTNNAFYTCTNAATGAAVWEQTIQVGNTAGGDLTGTLPNPTVSKITGVSVTGTPAYGQTVAATSSSAAAWQISPGFFAPTGISSGGVMTFHAGQPTQFDISAGSGYVTDYVTNPNNPVITKVTIAPQTIDLTTFGSSVLTRTTNWWLVNSSGVVSVIGTTPTNTQRRTFIVLGVTGSVPNTGVLFNVQPAPTVLNQPVQQIYDMFFGLGPYSISGNIVTSAPGTLNFNKSAGTVFDASFNYAGSLNDPHTITSPVETPAQFKYATRVAGSETTLRTNIDVANFDSGGTVTAIGGGTNTSAIHRVYLFGTGVATQQLAVQYGQATYASLAAAVSAIGAEPFVPNPDFMGIGFVIAWICAIRTATDLSNSAQASIVLSGKFVSP